MNMTSNFFCIYSITHASAICEHLFTTQQVAEIAI